MRSRRPSGRVHNNGTEQADRSDPGQPKRRSSIESDPLGAAEHILTVKHQVGLDIGIASELGLDGRRQHVGPLAQYLDGLVPEDSVGGLLA